MIVLSRQRYRSKAFPAINKLRLFIPILLFYHCKDNGYSSCGLLQIKQCIDSFHSEGKNRHKWCILSIDIILLNRPGYPTGLNGTISSTSHVKPSSINKQTSIMKTRTILIVRLFFLFPYLPGILLSKAGCFQLSSPYSRASPADTSRLHCGYGCRGQVH